MKAKQLLLAVAATLVSAQAFAVQTTPVTQAQIAAPGSLGLQQTWITGSSAATFPAFDAFAQGCNAGTLAVFTSATSGTKPGSIGNFQAYACTRGTGSAEKVSVLYHSIAGGSLYAYTPHTYANFADANAFIDRLKNLTASGSTCATANSTTFTLGANTVPVHYGCGLSGASTANITPITSDVTGLNKPVGGFSDVEAAAFGASLTGNVSAHGTEADANLNQTFGVAVSTNLYRQMQVAQNIYGSVSAANTADPSYDPANAPNITSAQYTSIAAFGGGYQSDWSPILGSAGSGKAVYLARRANTSGTQASSNMFFLHNPCSGASQLAPATAADTTSTFIVTEGAGTGDVKKALTTANGAGNYAIGLVSLENDWRIETATNSAQYRFIKLDGVHPEAGSQSGTQTITGAVNGVTSNYYTARVAGANGTYPLHNEMKYYIGNDVPADTFGLALLPDMVTKLATPTVCADIPRGVDLNPQSGSSCTVGTEVSKGTKFGDNCKANVMFF